MNSGSVHLQPGLVSSLKPAFITIVLHLALVYLPQMSIERKLMHCVVVAEGAGELFLFVLHVHRRDVALRGKLVGRGVVAERALVVYETFFVVFVGHVSLESRLVGRGIFTCVTVMVHLRED